ncbi:hypothetical protein ACPCK9_02295 [Streptomyces koyangensis]|uniref:hypothetical protein n=1 Tax=Streptomyces koyangensis TaxID=188770 RepID=UPI003C2FD6EB
MCSEKTVGEAELAEREELAEQVTQKLLLAGFTPSRRGAVPGSGGFQVNVDLAADAHGGVFVTWHTSESLRDEAIASKLSGEEESPSLEYFKSLTKIMHSAMIDVLRAAGWHACDAANDMNPYAIRVEDKGN